MIRLCLLAIVVGLVLRGLALSEHVHPRGDVVLDVGVARSLDEGHGFASGFTRGTSLVVGSGAPGPQDLADQHPPAWPLVGVASSWLAGSPFAGLKLVSLLCGLALLALVWRVTDRLVEGVHGLPDGLPAVATALVALSFLMVDSGANGSLYTPQALGVLLLVERLAAPRPSPLRLGLLLGLLCLLNHQNAVLAVLPVLVLVLAAPPGRRRGAFGTGLAVLGIAAACQLPWWIRNAQAFGEPFYSVNQLYFLFRAGVEPAMSIQDGWPVARFGHGLSPGLAWSAARTWLAPNFLYVVTTGLMLWPGLLGIVPAGVPTLLARARAARDRRLLACLLACGLLLAAALFWPATKLRYLVTLVPLVAVLGARLLAERPSPGERRLAWLVGLVWLALVLLTLDDLTGSAGNARPARWWMLSAGGAGLALLPLVLRHVEWVGPHLRLWICSGLLVAPLVTCVARFPPKPHPATTYHSSILTPDFFGQPAELQHERDANVVRLARLEALERGAQQVAGPIELLAGPAPKLVRLPLGAGGASGDEALAAIVDAGAVDHVVVLEGRGWPDGLLPGERWLADRLQVVARWPATQQRTGATLSRVVR